jgi:hypothetical protein
MRRVGLEFFRRGTLLFLLFGMILASGCLFQPRWPEEPDADSVPWTLPIDPESVLENMRSAVDSRTRTNYENSLGEGDTEELRFLFIPSFNDVQQASDQGKPDYFDAFNRTRELAALDKLYTQVDSVSIEWSFDPATQMVQESEKTTIYINGEDANGNAIFYQLYVGFTGTEPIVFTGQAVLTLRLVDGQWFLTRWDETESASEYQQSWGRLRLNLDV